MDDASLVREGSEREGEMERSSGNRLGVLTALPPREREGRRAEGAGPRNDGRTAGWMAHARSWPRAVHVSSWEEGCVCARGLFWVFAWS